MTSRAQILAAARRLIDQDGWEKLTVRRLAGELGIGTTTLYHHLRDKEDLLLLVLNEYIGQIPMPELPAEPRERIVVAAVAMRDALAGWPWATEVLITDGFLGLLSGTAVRIVDTIIAAAIASGCPPEQAVHVFRNIWYFTVGEILVRVRSRTRGLPGDMDFAGFDPELVPTLAAVGERWPTLSAQDTYAQGVRALVEGQLPPRPETGATPVPF
ncbi:TetR/AcrR family transcriptional regulator [Paractinoplanes durhamensis]|uniref:TetR/AcrR family transcriptional regulator n=1 Tax=Paractinoplanes durhamensis TaxID=113563 RepID=UPI001EF1F4AA|nr:TetR/AcrR family transcriptional regulator [Actinoplanes durhamensis]